MIFKVKDGAGKMSQWLRMLTALLENLNFVISPHALMSELLQ